MNIVLASIFRNSATYLERWGQQAVILQSELAMRGHELAVLVAEGDSKDNTRTCLQRWVYYLRGRVLNLDHGGPEFGSVNKAQRWAQITGVWNDLYRHFDDIEADAVIHVESDLIWRPETMRRLLGHLEEVPAVSPMVWHKLPGRFYDTYGFRKDGANFTYWPPHHPALETQPSDLVQIDTAGSCLVMRASVARGVWFDPDAWHPGPSIYCQGASLWLDRKAAVTHP